MTDNKALSSKLAAKGGKQVALSLQHTLQTWFEKNIDTLKDAAGGDLDVARKVYAVCLGYIARSPQLLDCNPQSLTTCIIHSISTGLFPKPFNECAYVPFKGEAQFIAQYEGLIKLILDAGNKAAFGRVVRVGDLFEYYEGEKAPLYVPAAVLGNKRGDRLFAYAAICNRSGYWLVEVFDPERIATIKARSPAARHPSSPWNSQYEYDIDAMWAKCPLRHLAKFVSKNQKLADAIESDKEADGEIIYKPKIVDLNVDNPSQEKVLNGEYESVPEGEQANQA